MKPNRLYLAAAAGLLFMVATAQATFINMSSEPYETTAGGKVLVEAIVETGFDLVSFNPTFVITPVTYAGAGEPMFTRASVLPAVGNDQEGSFWGSALDQFSPQYFDLLGDPGVKYNMSLPGGTTATGGPAAAVLAEVMLPDDAELGDKWNIQFLLGSASSTYQVSGEPAARNAFDSVTDGMITIIVPEPEALGLMLLAVVGLTVGYYRRRS